MDLSIVNSSASYYRSGIVTPPAFTSPRLKTIQTRCAFSTMELLLVIGVIAVIAALLIPVVGSSMESSRKVRCISHLRQMGAALRAYAFDRNGSLPGFGGANIDTSSFGPINQPHLKLLNGGYVTSTDIFFCPSDTIRRPLRNADGWAPNPEQGNMTSRYTSYFHFYHRPGSLASSTLPDNRARYRTSDPPQSIIASDQWTYGPFTAFHKDRGINVLRLQGTVDHIPYAEMVRGRTDAVHLFYRFEPPIQ